MDSTNFCFCVTIIAMFIFYLMHFIKEIIDTIEMEREMKREMKRFDERTLNSKTDPCNIKDGEDKDALK